MHGPAYYQLILYLYSLLFHAGSVPCIESMMRSMSRRARAESEFNALVELVSDAIREARKHHIRGGVKVCVNMQKFPSHCV